MALVLKPSGNLPVNEGLQRKGRMAAALYVGLGLRKKGGKKEWCWLAFSYRWGTKKYVTQIYVEKPFQRSQDLEPVGSPGLVRVLVKELRGGTGTPATGQDRTEGG